MLDDCQLTFELDNGLPFLEKNRQYYGIPASDEIAIAELERMRREGASYLIIAWCSFWWLQYFAAFRQHIEDSI